MLFDILALISVVCVIPLISRITDLCPRLLAGLTRWKEHVNLQTSLKTRTDRDLAALALILPFCLTAFRFRLYTPEFMAGMKPDAGLAVTIGVFLTFLLLRFLTYHIFRSHKIPSATYGSAAGAANSFFIILCLLLMLTGGLLTLFDVPSEGIRVAMFWLSGTTYALFLLRKAQIFLSSCNFLMSFLYLCALEILPTGVLIASAVVF